MSKSHIIYINSNKEGILKMDSLLVDTFISALVGLLCVAAYNKLCRVQDKNSEHMGEKDK